MIIAVTSKRGGTGGTTLSLAMSYCLYNHYHRNCCVVDLRNNNDIKKLLQLNTNACVDNLLSEFGVNSKFTTVEENTVKFNGINIIPGVYTVITNYLLKKVNKLKELLIELNNRYDVVILDILDDELLETLVDIGVDILPVNVLDQNRLVIEEYQKDITSGFLKGIMVVNQINESVWPQEKLFRHFFKANTLFILPFSDKLKSTMNMDGIKWSDIVKTEFFNAFIPVCKCVDEKVEEYNRGKYKENEDLTLESILETKSPKSTKPQQKTIKKKGFFASLFVSKKKGGVKRWILKVYKDFL